MAATVKSAKVILRRVASFFEKHPEAWTQKSNARDAAGNPVFPLAKRAVCWCLNGRVFYELGIKFIPRRGPKKKVFAEISERIHVGVGIRTPSFWNDAKKRKVGEVVAACRKAVEAKL